MSNTNELQKSGLDSGQIETLAKAGVIPANTPAAIVQVFAHACKEHNLSPFKKEIYLVKYGSQYSTIVGIDGFRIKAARTGQYAGADDIKFDVQSNGAFFTAAQLKAAGKLPVTATATVYRIVGGVRCPFTHTAVFAEFYGTAAAYSKAASMPFQMISKVAEGFALKKGFSDELAGLHIEEEAAAFSGETIEATKYKKEPQELPELLPGSNDWQQAVEYMAANFADCDEAITRLRSKRKISDIDYSIMIEDAHAFLAQKQNAQ